jgi:hypothetical protein
MRGLAYHANRLEGTEDLAEWIAILHCNLS